MVEWSGSPPPFPGAPPPKCSRRGARGRGHEMEGERARSERGGKTVYRRPRREGERREVVAQSAQHSKGGLEAKVCARCAPFEAGHGWGWVWGGSIIDDAITRQGEARQGEGRKGGGCIPVNLRPSQLRTHQHVVPRRASAHNSRPCLYARHGSSRTTYKPPTVNVHTDSVPSPKMNGAVGTLGRRHHVHTTRQPSVAKQELSQRTDQASVDLLE